jgi:bifunctional non-homologous end joining protein LigD
MKKAKSKRSSTRAPRKDGGPSAKSGSDLSAYRGKRDFSKTPEPAGGAADALEGGRMYVIQKHDATNLHYDLRLEMDGVLKSWAVPKGPSLDPSKKPLAVHTEDHPIEYGGFEGIIPQDQYGGGTVMIWDRGEWEPIGDPSEAYAKGDLKFRLHGQKLRGEWAIVKMGGKAAADGNNWLLIKKKDSESRPVDEYDVLAQQARSAATGRTMKEIAEAADLVWTEGRAQPRAGGEPANAPPPTVVEASALTNARKSAQPEIFTPQLAQSDTIVPEGDDWIHEIKLDGYRLVAIIERGDVRLMTRNKLDWTDRFPRIADALKKLPIDQAILDGEVVVLDSRGVPDFQLLQNAFRGKITGQPRAMAYFVFDLPHAGGYDLARVPIEQRKTLLRTILSGANLEPTVHYCDHIVGKGPVVLEQAIAGGFEGIISKRLGSHYEPRRSYAWLKFKGVTSQDFVVAGFTKPTGSRHGFGSLVLGQYEDGKLYYRGRAGSGFTDESLETIDAELRTRVRKTSPFAAPADIPAAKAVTWVEPELVAHVEFSGWSDDGMPRHPVFKGLRPEVNPENVIAEDPLGSLGRKAPSAERESRPRSTSARPEVVKAQRAPEDAVVLGVRISNPNRNVYPEAAVTKKEVAQYYASIAEAVVPQMAGRPLSIVRCPLGLAGESFYQKHLGKGFPEDIHEMPIPNDPDLSMYVTDAKGLVSLVQMGVLEIHPWGCRMDNVDRPDRLIFDLDPGEGIEWEHIVASAHFLRKYLGDLGLESFVKTSGGKGIHVVVPIQRRSTWEEAKVFTRAIAQDIVRIAPRNFVAVANPPLRKQRIYIDYLRNTRGATAVGAYSTRAREGAMVSTPLTWDELTPETTPDKFTVRTVPLRLATPGSDPWAGIGDVKQSITSAMKDKLDIG